MLWDLILYLRSSFIYIYIISTYRYWKVLLLNTVRLFRLVHVPVTDLSHRVCLELVGLPDWWEISAEISHCNHQQTGSDTPPAQLWPGCDPDLLRLLCRDGIVQPVHNMAGIWHQRCFGFQPGSSLGKAFHCRGPLCHVGFYESQQVVSCHWSSLCLP